LPARAVFIGNVDIFMAYVASVMVVTPPVHDAEPTPEVRISILDAHAGRLPRRQGGCSRP
jgi:hypothetical protein